MIKKILFNKVEHPCFIGFLFLFLSWSVNAHVTEIRVNQNADGTLTWYLQTYHDVNSCDIENAGISINGVRYEIASEHEGSIISLSENIFGQYDGHLTNTRRSYAVVETPYIAGVLNVIPYSDNVCWAFLVPGNGSFSPPPPEPCTILPVTKVTSTIGDVNDNQTCDVLDDTVQVNMTIEHLACGYVTGDLKFHVYLDPNGANIFLGTIYYEIGIVTPFSFELPIDVGTEVLFIDKDFTANTKTKCLSITWHKDK